MKYQAAFPRASVNRRGKDTCVPFSIQLVPGLNAQLEGATVNARSENVPGFPISWGKDERGEPETSQRRTYKWFPSMFLFVAPRKLMRPGSECSSPTMVGPTSCRERQQSR